MCIRDRFKLNDWLNNCLTDLRQFFLLILVDHCRPAPWVTNAVARLNPASRSVNITCFIGYRFPDGVSFKVLHCYPDGHWDDIPNCDGTCITFPIKPATDVESIGNWIDCDHLWFCSVIYCPKLSRPADGTLSTDEVIFNTVVTVACNIGFKHSDGQLVKSVRCLDSQTWNDTFADCQRMDN